MNYKNLWLGLSLSIIAVILKIIDIGNSDFNDQIVGFCIGVLISCVLAVIINSFAVKKIRQIKNVIHIAENPLELKTVYEKLTKNLKHSSIKNIEIEENYNTIINTKCGIYTLAFVNDTEYKIVPVPNSLFNYIKRLGLFISNIFLESEANKLIPLIVISLNL